MVVWLVKEIGIFGSNKQKFSKNEEIHAVISN